MFEYFDGKDYPGRGILIGLNDSGKEAVIAYFIMGRSANSRNRRFEIEDETDLMIYPADESKVEDPSLIIYCPLRDLGDVVVVTNGDQTDTIVEHLNAGGDFKTALGTRTYEPDAPNFTPRISGLLNMPSLSSNDCRAASENEKNKGFTYKLGILKKHSNDSDDCDRLFYDYKAIPGEAHLIHTYRGAADGVLLSFEGEPVKIEIGGNSIEDFTDKLYDALDGENLISLFVRYINLESGETVSEIINKTEDSCNG